MEQIYFRTLHSVKAETLQKMSKNVEAVHTQYSCHTVYAYFIHFPVLNEQ